VDTRGQLSDGAPLRDMLDLKRYLVELIDVFSRCLTEKLMVYAAVRDPSFGDRKTIEDIVESTKRRGNDFQDLIVELVLSESFLVKRDLFVLKRSSRIQ
jgi:hypothetical protein